MQDHHFDFVLDASPEDVWDVMWRQMRRDVTAGPVRIEILHPGDDDGNGLVRHCWFPVPRSLLSGGRGQSWEWITEADRPHGWRYDAVGRPPWSRATGWTRLEDAGGSRTRLHFRETYEVGNPVTRALLEHRVHRFISRDNDRLLEDSVNAMLRRLRDRRAREGTGPEPVP